MTLNIKTGDWAVLRNGTVIGPILPNEDDNEIYVWKIDDFTWMASGEFLKDARTEKSRGCDIIATLPCPPLERIRQLEEALRPFAEEAGRYDPVENDDDAYLWATSVTLGQLRAARRALGESK